MGVAPDGASLLLLCELLRSPPEGCFALGIAPSPDSLLQVGGWALGAAGGDKGRYCAAMLQARMQGITPPPPHTRTHAHKYTCSTRETVHAIGAHSSQQQHLERPARQTVPPCTSTSSYLCVRACVCDRRSVSGAALAWSWFWQCHLQLIEPSCLPRAFRPCLVARLLPRPSTQPYCQWQRLPASSATRTWLAT